MWPILTIWGRVKSITDTAMGNPQPSFLLVVPEKEEGSETIIDWGIF
jgi:hypothetical protein